MTDRQNRVVETLLQSFFPSRVSGGRVRPVAYTGALPLSEMGRPAKIPSGSAHARRAARDEQPRRQTTAS